MTIAPRSAVKRPSLNVLILPPTRDYKKNMLLNFSQFMFYKEDLWKEYHNQLIWCFLSIFPAIRYAIIVCNYLCNWDIFIPWAHQLAACPVIIIQIPLSLLSQVSIRVFFLASTIMKQYHSGTSLLLVIL